MVKQKIIPPGLKQGDTVAVISPSFAIDEEKTGKAVALLESWGLVVITGKNILKKDGPFAGTDDERLSDLQEMTRRKEVRAVFCSRGGYGMSRIIGRVDFSSLKDSPKWYIGFSDITVLLMWLSKKCNIVSIHGEMPLNFANKGKTTATIESLHDALFGGWEPIRWKGEYLRPADAEGEVTGGNLSLLCSLAGSPAEPETKGKILFIEDVGEHYYHLDRMMVSLKFAGKLEGLAALVAGGFTEMQETVLPWEKSAASIIAEHVSEYKYPVFFDFPAGHTPDNRAFYIGRCAGISVNGAEAVLYYK